MLAHFISKMSAADRIGELCSWLRCRAGYRIEGALTREVPAPIKICRSRNLAACFFAHTA